MTTCSVSLNEFASLAMGDRAKVVAVGKGEKAYRLKLLALGLTPGTEFVVTRVAPLGDPVEIRVRDCAISLRKQEAALLCIAKIG